LLIATPAYGDIFYTPYVQSMFRLHRALGPAGWTLSFASIAYADIAEARNFLLTHWYDKTDASHLLFVDADMGFDGQLVPEMLAIDKPVTGVIYPRRQINLERLAERAAAGESPGRAIAGAHDFIVRPVRGRTPARMKGFVEVEACGTGIMLIERSCVTALLKQQPRLSDKDGPGNSPIASGLARLIRAFDPVTVDGARLSEDFSFCRRWRDCGGEVWARADKPVTHIGMHRFQARFVDATGPHISVRTQRGPVQPGAAKPGVDKSGVAKPRAAAGGGSKPRASDAAAGSMREGGKPGVRRIALKPPAKGKPAKH
jgi:hypothetical protein